MNKKIAVLCPLENFDRTYSVAGVVLDQLTLLSKHYEIDFITTQDFNDHKNLPTNTKLKLIPRWNDTNLNTITKLLNIYLKNVTHCLVHDVLFVDCFLPLNKALRDTQNQHTTFLFFSHSAPSLDQNHQVLNRQAWPGKAYYIALNRLQVKDLAKMYNVPEGLVRLIPNSINPVEYFNFDNVAEYIYSNFKLWQYDNICLYPTRICQAKQIEKVIKLINQFKKFNLKACLIIAGSYSNNVASMVYLQELKKLVNELKFEGLILTPELIIDHKKLELGLSRNTIKCLFNYSDIFVLPSISEACPLSLLEAGLSKNNIVLNEDLYSLQDFGGQKLTNTSSLKAHYLQFGSLTRNIVNYYPSEELWYEEHAKLLLEEIIQDKAINFFKYVRKEFDPNYIYEQFLSPLLV